jgi:hypothetical protein
MYPLGTWFVWGICVWILSIKETMMMMMMMMIITIIIIINLKLERWGSPLVQEKYRGEKACDKRHP